MLREGPISNKVDLFRPSPFDDGKIINVLLLEFEKGENEYSHYVLIESTFLKINVILIQKLER